MTPDQATANIIAQTAFMNCRVAGMVAENMQRAATGQSMAYTDADFAGVEAEFEPILVAPWIDWKAECEAWRAVAMPFAEASTRARHHSYDCICAACMNTKEALSKMECLIDRENERSSTLKGEGGRA